MATAKPRLLYANRTQCELRSDSVEQVLPADHPVRAIWAFVERLDLTALFARIRSVPGHAGAPAIDPRILVALWLQATADGIGSSRALARLCVEHLAYRWLVGQVEVGYHTLADFRTDHGEVLNDLLSQSVAVLLHEDLIDLKRVAQDGLRVRAAAGSSSFRRSRSIEECLTAARSQVAALQSQADEDDGAASRRQQAARERAARERVERLERAAEELKTLQDANETQSPSRRKDPETLRASTTDPESRRMKMPDGGFRPAYNVQLATTTAGGVIVGVDVTSEGTDATQMTPMIEQIETRFDRRPEEMLVDGGFATVESIDAAERGGTTVYAPVREEQKQLDRGQDPYARKKSDTDATAVWRARMGTEEAKAIYCLRGCTAEWANAQVRNRGLYAVTVRGQKKVLAVVLWYALLHNLWRWKTLRATASGERAASEGAR